MHEWGWNELSTPVVTSPFRYDNDLAVPELAGIRQAYLSGFVIGSTNGKLTNGAAK